MPGVVFIPQRGADYWDCTFNGTVQHCVAGYYPTNPIIVWGLVLLIFLMILVFFWGTIGFLRRDRG